MGEYILDVVVPPSHTNPNLFCKERIQYEYGLHLRPNCLRFELPVDLDAVLDLLTHIPKMEMVPFKTLSHH